MALSTPAAVVLELMTIGQQSVAHLGELLMAASPQMEAERGQALTAEILRCCDRVIAAISRGAASTKRKAIMEPGVMPSKRRARGAEARREVQSGTTADGFVWRKYGQKDINGSKHQRFYYRCAYSGEGCGATRRVQQSQEDPAAFVIAYYGEHTCGGGAGVPCQQDSRAAMPPAVGNSASNARGVLGVVDRYQNVESRRPFLAAEQSWRLQCEAPRETSRGRWSSSSSSSSEAGSNAGGVIAYYGEHTWGGGDLCQKKARAAMPPAVLDSGSNAGGVVGIIDRYQNMESPRPLLAAEQNWCRHGEALGEMSRGRWSSSSSSSSEAELGTSPVLEFLEGSRGVGWECVVNYLGFNVGLPEFSMLQ